MKDARLLLFELQQLISQLSVKSSGKANIEAIPIQPATHETLIQLITSLIAEGDLHRTNYWAAHMTPAISSASLMGQIIAGLHNGNLLSPQLYPILAKIEHQLISWLCELFQQQHGHFVAGSSYANLEALWQAKQDSLKSSRIIYASTAAHYSIAKACQILDLELRLIPTNDNDQLLSDLLAKACSQSAPLAIIATAGTSASGAIDPLTDCIQIAHQYGAWCHIDAAWGGGLVLLPEFKDLFGHASQANSICFDPHKSWQQPKPASVLLYRQTVTPILSEQVSYLEQQPLNNLPGSRGGELFLPLWFSIMSSGLEGLRQQLCSRLQQAEYFSTQLSQRTTWHVYQSPTGIICFSPDKNCDLTGLVQRGIFSKAKIADKDVYRAVFASPNTSAKALIAVLEPYF